MLDRKIVFDMSIKDLFIIALLWISPLLRGLFFEGAYLVVIGILALAGIVALLKDEEKRSSQSLGFQLLLGLSFLYGLSSIWAIEARGSLHGFMKYMGLSVVFLLVYSRNKSENGRRTILFFLGCASGLLAIIGLLGDLSFLTFGHLVFEDRLASVLEYPNTYAAFSLTAAISLLGAASVAHKGNVRWWCIRGLYAISIIGIVPTHSRIVWAMTPLVLLAALLYSVIKKCWEQVALLIGGTSIAAVTAFAYLSVRSERSLTALALLVGGIVIASICTELINRLLLKMEEKKWLRNTIVMSVTIAVLAFLLLITQQAPITFENGEAEGIAQQVSRYWNNPEASTTYTLSVVSEGTNEDQQPYAGQITIVSYNTSQKGRSVGTMKLGAGEGGHSFTFTTPKDTVRLRFSLQNRYPKTSVTLSEWTIANEDGKKVESLWTTFRYIPEELITRLSNISIYDHSFAQRIQYMDDSLKIFKNHWLAGAGGNAWKNLYKQYQDYQYDSDLAHSYPVAVLLDLGILGLVPFLFLLLLPLIAIIRNRYWKSSPEIIFASLALYTLLAHSVVDFDFSLYYIQIIFVVLLALMPFEGVEKLQVRQAKYVVVGMLAITVLLAGTQWVAGSISEKADGLASPEEQMEAYGPATALDPFHASYKVKLAESLIATGQHKTADGQKRLIELADGMIANNKGDSTVHATAGRVYAAAGKIDESITALKRSTDLSPLNGERYRSEVSAYLSLYTYFAGTDQRAEAFEIVKKESDAADRMKGAMTSAERKAVVGREVFIEFAKAHYAAQTGDQTGEVVQPDRILFATYPGRDIDGDGRADSILTNLDNAGLAPVVDGESLTLTNTSEKQKTVVIGPFELDRNTSYQIDLPGLELASQSEAPIELLVFDPDKDEQVVARFAGLNEDNTRFTFTTDKQIVPKRQQLRLLIPAGASVRVGGVVVQTAVE